MDRIEEIHRRLPNCHLVMHGSSSVPQDLQDIINKYGGKLKQTWGVPVEEIQRGIKHGVRKINVDTDNRLAITGAIRKVFAEVARKVRPARLPQAGPRRDEESLHRPHDRLRPGRPGPQDQARLLRQVRQLLRDGVAARLGSNHRLRFSSNRHDRGRSRYHPAKTAKTPETPPNRRGSVITRPTGGNSLLGSRRSML